MSNIQYQANVYEENSSNWHLEIFISGGLLALAYKENGRESKASDITTFPADIAEDMAKAILRVVELSKEGTK